MKQVAVAGVFLLVGSLADAQARAHQVDVSFVSEAVVNAPMCEHSGWTVELSAENAIAKVPRRASCARPLSLGSPALEVRHQRLQRLVISALEEAPHGE